MVELKGIDVSKHQTNIDWIKVKTSGIDFAILRCGVTLWGANVEVKDETFEANYAECKNNNLGVGAYYYSAAFNLKEADEEIEMILSILKGKQLDYPFCIDVENNERQKVLTTQELTDICKYIMQKIEASGYYVMLYMSRSWLQNEVFYNQLTGYDVWLAEWGNAPIWQGTFGIWQYTSDGVVDGIGGRVDMNISYKDYPTIIKNAGLNGYSKSQPVAPVAPPVFNHARNIGEWVTYSTCYANATDGVNQHLNQGGNAQIVEIIPFTQNYCKLSNGLFINDGDIRSLGQAVAPVKPVVPTFKDGDTVTVKNAINYDNGKSFKLWAKQYNIIGAPQGDRAVIGINGVVTSAIDIKNINKI